MIKRKTTILRLSFLTVLGCFCTYPVSGQENAELKQYYIRELSVEYGVGLFSLKDKYISDEKYSGSIPFFSLEWINNHQKYLYKLTLEYRNSDKIKNNNVSSNITLFALKQGFLYKLKDRKLLNKELDLHLGPTTDLFLFYNEPRIAVDGFDYSQSFAVLFSLRLNLTGNIRINSRFFLETSIAMTTLSLGIRMVDNEEEDQSPVKLLSPFNGLNTSFDFELRYYLFNHLSVNAAYRFELYSISAWHPLTISTDNMFAGLSYHF